LLINCYNSCPSTLNCFHVSYCDTKEEKWILTMSYYVSVKQPLLVIYAACHLLNYWPLTKPLLNLETPLTCPH
ncbi:hypothetical protein VIGAN_08086300, partial [Vigna angularis var. angularis]